jgi:hypothetical protein
MYVCKALPEVKKPFRYAFHVTFFHNVVLIADSHEVSEYSHCGVCGDFDVNLFPFSFKIGY